MDRIVDVATDKVHLSAYRGLLIVTLDHEEIGRVALDDIAAIIVHAHGVTWTTNLVVKLAERGALMVLCAANHAPVAMTIPIEGHHAQNARFRAQWESTLPFRKQAWKTVVQAKIRNQGSLLSALGREEGEALGHIADRVRSGDSANAEAQAARRYWPALLGRDFRRDRDAGGANALLNYGYTVMRAAVTRAIVAAGLHPTIGLHHANRLNAFALADDLVEPFRPLVDAAVQQMTSSGDSELNGLAKARLAALLSADLDMQGSNTPVIVAMQRLAQSLAMSFEQKKQNLTLFQPLTPLAWNAVASHIPDSAIR
ncbi:type II CRISPR-associated endonuclease Cas1 [Altererythrobacter indicus]|uniref:CRISPR-associated endonuclease Cas1 n=1 Tax=Altericroceibacterium indicum TaxID=374177 RepID=A0A845A801_9SPHN|nr:type II CRISPR-associated endonuclease Cas1 [Altericroceibacterium indicum]MXP25449.1 type II CRISPR-associated endonuclease Cas1 [Altericroceibacterium indicum]